MDEFEKPAFSEVPAESVEEAPKGNQENKGTAGGAQEPSVEETKVPYSRFKKFHERAIRAEEEARAARERLEAIESERETRREPSNYSESNPPGWWLENYGDTPASRKAWQNQYQHEQELRETFISEAEERAVERLKAEQQYESQRIEKNLETIDDSLDSLSAFVGRDLTEGEQSSVLDIVDEFTPKDGEGNYLGAIMPMEKAWEVYEMRNQTQNSSRRQSRNEVASLTGAQSRGEPSSEQKAQDDSFQPGNWGGWRKKIGF